MAAHPDARAGRSYVRRAFRNHHDDDLPDEITEAIRRVAVEYSAALGHAYAAAGTRNGALETTQKLEHSRSKIARVLGVDGSARLSAMLATEVKPKTRVFSKP